MSSSPLCGGTIPVPSLCAAAVPADSLCRGTFFDVTPVLWPTPSTTLLDGMASLCFCCGLGILFHRIHTYAELIPAKKNSEKTKM